MQSRIQSSGISSYNTSGAARYTPLGSGTHDTVNTTEAYAQIPFRTAGTLSNLHVRALAPGSGASATIKVRKNGADGNEAISIATNASGEFDDTSNTDSVTAGDLLCYSVVTNTSNYWIVGLSCLYEASSGMLSKLSTNHENGASRSSINTLYHNVDGLLSWFSTESNLALPSSVSGTLKNFAVYTDSNSRTAATTFGSRKNLGAGNLAISIGASSTGLFEDTSNTDTISAGDKINYQSTMSSGSGTLVIRFISSELVTTNNTFEVVSADSNSTSISSAQDLTFPVSGQLNQFSNWGALTSTIIEIKCSNLEVNVITNTLNGTTQVILQDSAGNTTLFVGIGAGTTGIFTDTTDAPFIAINASIKYRVLTFGSSGAIALTAIGVGAQTIPAEIFTVDGIILHQRRLRPKIKTWDMDVLPDVGSKTLNWSLPGDRANYLREMKDGVYHLKSGNAALEGTGNFPGSGTGGLFTETLVDGHMYAEERVKIVAASLLADIATKWGHVLELTTTHSDVELVFCTDGISLQYQDPTTHVATHINYVMDTTNDYHIYKLEVTYTTAKVYVDGVQQISVSIDDQGAGHFSLEMFIDENWTANVATEHYIDYIKLFPNNGATEIDFNGIDILYGFQIDDPSFDDFHNVFSAGGTREIVSGEYHWKANAAADDDEEDFALWRFNGYQQYDVEDNFSYETQVRLLSGSTHAAATKTLYFYFYGMFEAELLIYTDGVSLWYYDASFTFTELFVALDTSTNHIYKVNFNNTNIQFFIDGVSKLDVAGGEMGDDPELYIETNFDEVVTNEFYMGYLTLNFGDGFTVDGIIDAPVYHNFTADGVVLVTGNTKTFTADGIVDHPNNVITFTADGYITELAELLKDDFANGQDSSKWNSQPSTGTITFSNGQIVFTGSTSNGYNDYESKIPWDLRSSYIRAQVINAGNQSIVSNEAILYASIFGDTNNKVYISITNGNLLAQKIVGGVNTNVATVVYNSAVHKWIQVRESGGTIYYDYSTDGVSFTNFASVADPFSMDSMALALQQGTWQNEASTTQVIFDNFNVVRTNLTFTADGIIFGTNTKTFTLDGEIETTGNLKSFTMDAVIVNFSATFNRRYGFFLNSALLKNPIGFKKDYVYRRTDTLVMSGKSVRDFSGLKQKYTLTFKNLTPDQVAAITTIMDLKTPVVFEVDSADTILINTTVWPYIGNIAYQTIGSSYLADATIELIEKDVS